MSNRLASETSPYLLQHAQNPVDWYPWGAQAIALARERDKPILLSVGYSACHWCHVMERESFEDEATALLMNELFVSVKVDREERPDIDAIYMQAVQAMNGHGGWPMTVFLTPALEPFWAGTYFPPEDRPGMPSFRRVLRAVSDAYRENPDGVRRVAASMREMYAASRERVRSSGTISPELLASAARGLLAAYDPQHGGFGDAPKFPQPMAMEFLLQHWARTGDGAALDAVRRTFTRMARGGIYDQIGGGFARYSVDAEWLVPHFEKMLYDNALLARVGLHLWQATGDALARRVVEETLDWVAREMAAPAGGFFSALDADSEGEEGRFYLWTRKEFAQVLGPRTDAFASYWDVTESGNFEGRNILHVDDFAAAPPMLEEARRELYAARATRVRPARDEKILASWNGLALRAMAEAARAFGHPGYTELALRTGEFLFREMVRDSRVFRSHKDGVTCIPGFLADAAAVGLGSLAVYELTFDRVWLDRSFALASRLVEWFWDDSANTFFDTPSDHEEQLTRPREIADNAMPSGMSLAAELLLRLGDIMGDADMARRATFVLETVAEPMARHPLAFGHALTAADMVAYGANEVALAGGTVTEDFEKLASVVAASYVPSLVLAGGQGDGNGIALLADRLARTGRATAYVCRGYMCAEPTSDPSELQRQLAGLLAVTPREKYP